MNINANFVNFLYLALKGEPTFDDLTFVLAHENDIKPTPLEKPIVALSPKGCVIGDKLTKTNDNGEIVVTNKREVKSTVSIDIYLPYSMGGLEGHRYFDRIATYLLFVENFSITGATCSESDYDTSCQAIVLRSSFIFTNIVES
ncbi:MAG: hypothetical protein IKV25_02905 [Clostridia bacterium]|nr:hypothetical protein [Clostridia bacterium]